jgi:hypothetical protein
MQEGIGNEWTIEQWVEHGRKWLHAGWEWEPGQIAIASWPDGDEIEYEVCIVPWGGYRVLDNVVPDMRDPGTRGHALDQVRKAWGDYALATGQVDDRFPTRPRAWLVTSAQQLYAPLGGYATSEHEALLAAREAAP